MKILHLLQSSKFSGAENVACQIIQMFRNSEYEMAYSSQDGSVRDALAERGIAYFPLKDFTTKSLKKVIQDYKPDIIHAHDMRACFLAARVCGTIPLISHIHNNNFDSRKISPKAIAYLFAAIKSKHIFWVSESSFKGYAFSRFFRTKSTVLYNVIDLDALQSKADLGGDPYNFDVVFLGRLTTPKNPIRLLDVLKLVQENKPDIKIGIIGTGDMEEEVKAKAQEIGLKDNVVFTGFSKNPYKMLRNAKVMIMTSRWEGTPMCALESMGLGTPIVSTPVDGLIDIVKSGKNGYLEDSNEALANRISDILSSESLYNQLSMSAINDSRTINNLKDYRSKLEAIYNSSIKL